MFPEYERKFMYRFIKVAFILLLICDIGFFSLIAISMRPTPWVDGDKSVITCTNGKNYSLSTAKIYLYSTDIVSLDDTDDREARILCEYGVANDYSARYGNTPTPSINNYTLNLVSKTVGSWRDASLVFFLGIGVSYIVLQLSRETLNYVFFGKSFDWLWILIPISMLSESDRSRD